MCRYNNTKLYVMLYFRPVMYHCVDTTRDSMWRVGCLHCLVDIVSCGRSSRVSIEQTTCYVWSIIYCD